MSAPTTTAAVRKMYTSSSGEHLHFHQANGCNQDRRAPLAQHRFSHPSTQAQALQGWKEWSYLYSFSHWPTIAITSSVKPYSCTKSVSDSFTRAIWLGFGSRPLCFHSGSLSAGSKLKSTAGNFLISSRRGRRLSHGYNPAFCTRARTASSPVHR